MRFILFFLFLFIPAIAYGQSADIWRPAYEGLPAGPGSGGGGGGAMTDAGSYVHPNDSGDAVRVEASGLESTSYGEMSPQANGLGMLLGPNYTSFIMAQPDNVAVPINEFNFRPGAPAEGVDADGTSMKFEGGNAGDTGNSDGGDVILEGGIGAGSGSEGIIDIQSDVVVNPTHVVTSGGFGTDGTFYDASNTGVTFALNNGIFPFSVGGEVEARLSASTSVPEWQLKRNGGYCFSDSDTGAGNVPHRCLKWNNTNSRFEFEEDGTLQDLEVDDIVTAGFETQSGGADFNFIAGDIEFQNTRNFLLSTNSFTHYQNVNFQPNLDFEYSTSSNITASTTQTQGQGALTSTYNEVGTVANPNDTVTLDGLSAQSAGKIQIVRNNGANVLQIFPATGDNLGAGVNNSTTLAVDETVTFIANGDTDWDSFGSGGGGSMPEQVLNFPANALEFIDAGGNNPGPFTITGTNIDVRTYGYDDTADECAGKNFIVTPDLDGSGTVTFELYYTPETAAANDVYWDFRHVPVTNDEAWDGTLTTEADGGCTTVNTAGDVTSCTWTETVSNLGWAAGDMVEFLVCRDADNASDNLTDDARLINFSVRVPRS